MSILEMIPADTLEGSRVVWQAVTELQHRSLDHAARLDALEEVVAGRVVKQESNLVPWWARLLELRRREDQRTFKALMLGFLAGFVVAAAAVMELLG